MKPQFMLQILLVISLVSPLKAETQDFPNDFQNQITNDYKVAHYWAYYGQYSKNPALLGNAISRLSDLTSKIYNISNKNAYQAFKMDIHAQGGPQFLLSTVAIERVILGLSLGFTQDVSNFINSTHSLNPQLGASLAVMSLGYTNVSLNKGVRDVAMPPNPSHIDQCFRSCSIHFLGLQNNKFANDLFLGRATDSHRYSMRDQEQVNSRFPNQNNPQAKVPFRKNLDMVASVSNECIGACTERIFMGALSGAGIAARAMPGAGVVTGYLAVGGAIVGGSLGAVSCSTTSACSKSRQQETNEQESSRQKAENDLRTERKRKEELDRQDREERRAAEIEKQKKEEDSRKKDADQKERQKKEVEDRIANSFDRSKNKEEKIDSSASCETTKSCDGTMNATVIPEHYRELQNNEPLKDRKGNILSKIDLSGTPMPKDLMDEQGANHTVDSNGNILTNRDLTSTPMPKTDLGVSGPRQDQNGKIITKLDMVGNPGVPSFDRGNTPFIPPKNMGLNLNKIGSN